MLKQAKQIVKKNEVSHTNFLKVTNKNKSLLVVIDGC